MSVDYAVQELRTLQRAKRVLLSGLMDKLMAMNTEFKLTQVDRELVFPRRIVIGEPPSLPAENVHNELPAVFLRLSSSSPLERNLTHFDDVNCILSIDVILANPNRPQDDLFVRAGLYCAAVADVLQDRLREQCSTAEATGVFYVARAAKASSRPAQWGETTIVRASEALDVRFRYRRFTTGSLLAPELEDLPITHLPLQSAEPIVLPGDVEVPPYVPTMVPPGPWTVPAGWSGYTVSAGVVVPFQGGDQVPLGFQETLVVVNQPSGIVPSFITHPDPSLPADVLAVLALQPVHYFQMVHNEWLGQPVLFQDFPPTAPVTQEGQFIGSVVNLGTSPMIAAATGTTRPVWRGNQGAEFDGFDDWLNCQASPVTNVPPPFTYATGGVQYRSVTTEGRAAGYLETLGTWLQTASTYRARAATGAFPDPVMDIAIPPGDQFSPATHVVNVGSADSEFQVIREDGTLLGSASVSAITPNVLPTILSVGDRPTKDRAMDGFIRYFAAFPDRLTPAQIASLPHGVSP